MIIVNHNHEKIILFFSKPEIIFLQKKIKSAFQIGLNIIKTKFIFRSHIHISVMRVGSDTFGDPIFQKDLQN